MAAQKLRMRVSPLSDRATNKIQPKFQHLKVQQSTGAYGNTVRPNRKWENPRWRPPNFKCMYLRSQTRYPRNSNGHAYVFGVQLSNETHQKTMRTNRKWKNPSWRSVNFNCVFLRSQTRYRRNSNGYTHIFGVQHSKETSSDTVQPNRKWVIQDGGLKTSNACISASR